LYWVEGTIMLMEREEPWPRLGARAGPREEEESWAVAARFFRVVWLSLFGEAVAPDGASFEGAGEARVGAGRDIDMRVCAVDSWEVGAVEAAVEAPGSSKGSSGVGRRGQEGLDWFSRMGVDCFKDLKLEGIR
jgi:hypothetical protein